MVDITHANHYRLFYRCGQRFSYRSRLPIAGGNFHRMLDMTETLRLIDERVKALDTTDAAVSFEATGSKDTIRNWRRAVREGRKAGANTGKLQAIGKVLGIDLAFATRSVVPLVGYVGAGATAHFYASADSPDEWVDAPDGATANTVAVQIRGDSLGALFDQWIVYYDEIRAPVTPDLIGRLCVVGLLDDQVLVKRIRRAKTPGFYHLESNTQETIFDVEIAWAARVKSMVPR
ncbi:phage repressor protein [Mesorhizobium sp. Z1-4]|uniref:S24 family peptidase n=1 Tax=Mesorhizobium sp. Z1-4 TaxID=2448478 RepID=UPI00197E9B5A|nr:phage repressor protein [Mesorhizobium sp. Z1-4]